MFNKQLQVFREHVGIPTEGADVRGGPVSRLISSPAVGRPVYLSRIVATILLLVSTACPGRGPSSEDILRSRRELELAAALQQENNIPGAIGHLRTALDLDSENAEAHLLLGLIHFMNRNNAPLAEEHARRGVEILIQQERHGSTLAEARNILGTILIARGKYDEAIDILERSAMDDMNTSPHLAWGNLGLAYLEAGRPADAVEPLEAAVRIQPRFCVGYHRLGRAYYELDDMERAEAALIQALEADETCADNPMLQNAWRLRGEVRARLGHRDEALSDLERCVALGMRTEDGAACQRLLDRTPTPPNTETSGLSSDDTQPSGGATQASEGDAP